MERRKVAPLTVGKVIKPKPEVSRRMLDDFAQKLVDPIQQQAGRVDVSELKKTLGKDISKIAIGSLQGKLVGRLGGTASGYESKLWEKACC